nr:trypsin-3-like [Onthophagus taurus]
MVYPPVFPSNILNQISTMVVILQVHNIFGANTNISQDLRIINGSYAFYQENFSYQVSLSKFGQHFCGGTILNLEYIVTAAHCVYNNRRPSDITVNLGSLKQGLGDKRKVTDIFMHPGYDNKNLRHDIAILKIPSLGNFTNFIKNITLPDSSPKAGTNCTVAGWGVTETSDSGTLHLKYAKVPIISTPRCRASYKDQLKKEMFCAGYLEGGSDACQGDSGGGLICDQILTGVVSWGHECGEKYYPGVYTDVFYYKDWIRSKSNCLKLISSHLFQENN